MGRGVHITSRNDYKLDDNVRKASLYDVPYIYNNLREADREEVEAASTQPLLSLYKGVSEGMACFTALEPYTQTPCALFGVMSKGVWGRVWMVGTPFVERYPVTFIRQSRKWINILNTIWPVLYNVVYAKNKLHIEWLKWNGFAFMRECKIKENAFLHFLRGGKTIV